MDYLFSIKNIHGPTKILDIMTEENETLSLLYTTYFEASTCNAFNEDSLQERT